MLVEQPEPGQEQAPEKSSLSSNTNVLIAIGAGGVVVGISWIACIVAIFSCRKTERGGDGHNHKVAANAVVEKKVRSRSKSKSKAVVSKSKPEEMQQQTSSSGDSESESESIEQNYLLAAAADVDVELGNLSQRDSKALSSVAKKREPTYEAIELVDPNKKQYAQRPIGRADDHYMEMEDLIEMDRNVKIKT